MLPCIIIARWLFQSKCSYFYANSVFQRYQCSILQQWSYRFIPLVVVSAATLASSLRADFFLALCQNAGFAGYWLIFSAAYRTCLLHPSNSCLPHAKQRSFHRENRMYPTTSPVSSTWEFRSLILSDGPFCPCLPSLQLFFLSPSWVSLRAVGWTRLDRTLTPHSVN